MTTPPPTSTNDPIGEMLKKYSYAVQELHAGIIPFDDGIEASRHRHEAHQALEAYITTRVKEAELSTWKRVRKSYPKKQTVQGNAVSKLTLADVDREITALTTTTNGKEN